MIVDRSIMMPVTASARMNLTNGTYNSNITWKELFLTIDPIE